MAIPLPNLDLGGSASATSGAYGGTISAPYNGGVSMTQLLLIGAALVLVLHFTGGLHVRR